MATAAPRTPRLPAGISRRGFQHGFSTFWIDRDRDRPDHFVDIVGTAIDVGYRRLDCNPAWDTEEMVGVAIERSSVRRDRLFVTTVVPYGMLGAVGTRTSVMSSLERLRLDRMDLVLVSAPAPGWDVDGSAESLERLVEDGLVSHVGARYLSIADLDTFAARLDVPVFAHLSELHPLWPARHHRRQAAEHGFWIIADSPFMQGMVREVREVCRIAERLHASPWQVVLSWLHRRPGLATSTWTHRREQMIENLGAGELTLDDLDVEILDSIDRRWSASPHLHAPSAG